VPALATTAGAVVATVVAAITITVTTHFAAQKQRVPKKTRAKNRLLAACKTLAKEEIPELSSRLETRRV
jgi:hypothetical protein